MCWHGNFENACKPYLHTPGVRQMNIVVHSVDMIRHWVNPTRNFSSFFVSNPQIVWMHVLRPVRMIYITLIQFAHRNEQ